MAGSKRLALGSCLSIGVLGVVISLMTLGRLSLVTHMRAAQTDRSEFEAVSIKPNKNSLKAGVVIGGVRVMGIRNERDRMTATGVTLRALILSAYRDFRDFQLIGGPAWISSDRFDLVAVGGSDSTPEQRTQMLRNLLADRFKLTVEMDAWQRPVYVLVRARADGTVGPQLHPSVTDCDALKARGAAPPPPPGRDYRPPCGVMRRPGRITAGGTEMSRLAETLSPLLERIVVDQTGVSGRFDFDLEWAPDQFGPSPSPGSAADQTALIRQAPGDGPSIFTALQEQLGLKLNSEQRPVPVLVIQSAERPRED